MDCGALAFARAGRPVLLRDDMRRAFHERETSGPGAQRVRGCSYNRLAVKAAQGQRSPGAARARGSIGTSSQTTIQKTRPDVASRRTFKNGRATRTFRRVQERGRLAPGNEILLARSFDRDPSTNCRDERVRRMCAVGGDVNASADELQVVRKNILQAPHNTCTWFDRARLVCWHRCTLRD